MCYDVRYLTKKLRTYAERVGTDDQSVNRLENQLKVFQNEVGPVFHTTAFDHWRVPVITNNRPDNFQFFHWGLMPHFVRDIQHYASKYTNRYLNSRIETLFEEKIFNPGIGRLLENPYYKSAIDRRCIVVLDGYYDWHWQGKDSFNFHILLKDESPMIIAGIWRQWKSRDGTTQRDTVSLVTTEANALCRKIHNRPKASEGSRQLAVLDQASVKGWLDPDATIDDLKRNIRIYPESEMKAYPVKKLFRQEGRRRIPLNDEACVTPRELPGLSGQHNNEQGSLF